MAKAAEIVGLDCTAPVNAGSVLVLRTRLEEMCSYRAVMLDRSDPQGVKDMRVASRRLRSAARDFAPYLAKHLPRKRLRNLARALGNVRAEDVAIGALEELAEASPAEIAGGLRLHIAARAERRERARNTLAKLLAEPQLAKLRDRFLRTLARIEAVKVSSGTNGSAAHARTITIVGRVLIGAW